jgi:hypothetical protein
LRWPVLFLCASAIEPQQYCGQYRRMRYHRTTQLTAPTKRLEIAESKNYGRPGQAIGPWAGRTRLARCAPVNAPTR